MKDQPLKIEITTPTQTIIAWPTLNRVVMIGTFIGALELTVDQFCDACDRAVAIQKQEGKR